MASVFKEASVFKRTKILNDLMTRTSSVMTYSPLDDAAHPIMLVHMTSIKAECLIEESPGGMWTIFTYRSDNDNPLSFAMHRQAAHGALRRVREFYARQQADPTTRISREDERRAIQESDLLSGLNKLILGS
jgi:hypothetical protein